MERIRVETDELRKRNSLPNGTDTELNDEEKNKEYENGTTIHHEDLDPKTSSSWLDSTLTKVSGSTTSFVKDNKTWIKGAWIVIFNGLVLGFFIAALLYWINEGSEPLELCQGFGSLIAFLSIIYFFVIYFKLVKVYFGKWFEKNIWRNLEECFGVLWKRLWIRWCVSLCLLVAVAFFFYWDTRGSTNRLMSLSGIAILLLLGFVFSANPGRVNWRTVISGLILQFALGIIFIRWNTGRMALQCFADKVATFLSYGVDGAAFAYGELLVRKENVFAFASLPVIFFFSMMVEVLFFWGALQWFCLKLGQVLRAATATTVCESVICVGNMFLGMTESILLIKPYVGLLTPSELHVVLASGFATVSGTILATYIAFGAEAAYLVTASVMAAPAAVCYSKLMMPETKRSLTTVDNIQPVKSEDQSTLSAATRGATNGIGLIMNILANIIAFVAFISFVNGVLGYFGGLLGFPTLTLEWLFGKIFIPLCFVMGVPWEECEYVASLIGLKTMVNEFVAYQRMGEMKRDGLLSPRSELIATFSLCGFTNPGSLGIMVGAVSAIAPHQRETLAKIAVRAFFAGCGICFINASLAGLLMPDDSFT